MAKRAEAYVDTSAFIAFVDRSNIHHDLFRRLFSAPPSLITSALVIAEGHAWFLRRHNRGRALQFLAMLEEMRFLTVAPVGAREQEGATALLRRFFDQDLTMTDAVGLYLMRDRKVACCWSTDFHLGLTGVPLALGCF